MAISVEQHGKRAQDTGIQGSVRLLVDKQLPDEWDLLSAGCPPTVTARWLRLAPQRLPGEPVFFSLEKNGTTLLAVGGVVMTEPSGNTRIDPYSIFSGASSYQGLAADGPHPWRDIRADRAYPCLLLMFPHYELLPVGPAAGDEAACGRLVAEITRWARQAGIRSIAAEYLAPEAAALTAALRSLRFTVVEFASRCDLDVTWDDFDGYLGTLPPRRRVKIRRELRAIDERGISIVVRELRRREDELVPLRCQLVAKYGGQPNPAKEYTMLDRLLTEFSAAELTVIEARQSGRALGFGLFAQEGSYWVPLMTGSDYSDPQARLTYFASLFYRPCELAPGLGVARISYGLGSWEAKRLRGCALYPLYGAAALVGGQLPPGPANGRG